MLFSIEVN